MSYSVFYLIVQHWKKKIQWKTSVASQVNTNFNKHNLHLKMEAKRNNPFVYIKYLIQKRSCQKNEVTDRNPCEHNI